MTAALIHHGHHVTPAMGQLIVIVVVLLVVLAGVNRGTSR